MGEYLQNIDVQLDGIRKELHGTNGRGLWETVRDIDKRLDRLEKRMVAIFSGIAVIVTVANVVLAYFI